MYCIYSLLDYSLKLNDFIYLANLFQSITNTTFELSTGIIFTKSIAGFTINIIQMYLKCYLYDTLHEKVITN